MKRTIIILLCAFGLMAGLAVGEIDFIDSYDAALQRAVDTDAKLLITFYSDT